MPSKLFIIDGLDLDILESRRLIEPALGVVFEERDSSYNASAYFSCRLPNRHLTLFENEDFGGAPIYDECQLKDVLLRVNCEASDDEMFAAISRLSFMWPLEVK